jgi:NAD+ kinase
MAGAAAHRVQNAVLIANLLSDNAYIVKEEISSELESLGTILTVFSYQECPDSLSKGKWDIAFTLGGDGTVLYAARTLAHTGTPILPIHLGTVGFLAGERHEWLTVYRQWLDGKSRLSSRCMLEFSVERAGLPVFSGICLNDVVISSSGIAKLIRLRAKTEVAPGEYAELGYYRSDGLIIATPTGSTAYSMAAGGPILDPEMEAQIICPICPFTLSNRPLVLPSRQTLHITVETAQRSGVLLTADGQESFGLKLGDKIIIRHSSHYTRLITSGRSVYYLKLSEKLGWGVIGGYASFGDGASFGGEHA